MSLRLIVVPQTRRPADAPCRGAEITSWGYLAELSASRPVSFAGRIGLVSVLLKKPQGSMELGRKRRYSYVKERSLNGNVQPLIRYIARYSLSSGVTQGNLRVPLIESGRLVVQPP